MSLYSELELGDPPEAVDAALGDVVSHVRFRSGEAFVLEEGEVDDEVLLILSGEARLERVVDGEAREISTLSPGDVAGEAHFLLGDSGTDRVVATESIAALSISRAALEKLSSEPEAEPLLGELDRRAKVARLRAATPLACMSFAALLELADDVEDESFAAGATLLSADEEPGRLAVIRAGRAVALSGEGGDRHVVAYLLPGDSFGEAALLGEDDASHAGLAVEAETDVELFRISPSVFDRVLAEHPEEGAAVGRQVAGLNLVSFLRHSSPFAGCDGAILRRLAAAMEPRTYPAGTDIVREGEEGEAYFVITSGRVCLDTDETEGVKVLEELGPGDGFGEGALVSGETCDHTATATEDTEVLALAKDDFLAAARSQGHVLGRMADTLARRRLPARIPHVSVVRQETAGGEVLYVLKDEERGKYFKLSERGYFLWERMDGNASVRDLVMAYMLEYKTFSVEQVLGLIESLEASGFVRSHKLGEYLLPEVRPSMLSRAGRTLRSLMYITIPIKGFDPAVSALYRWFGWIFFTRVSLAFFAALAVSGLGAFAYLLMSDAVPSWQPILGGGIPAYYGLLAALILMHESAHALAVKSYGREVRRGGFGFMFATPFLYIDTSDMWMDTRRARIAVSWAGPYLHLILGSAAAWAMLLVPGLRESGFAVTFLVVNYVFVLANLFPLLEFDGYYMLMDYLEIPRLRNKAIAFVGKQIRRPTSPLGWGRVERIYGGFGAVSGAYMILITFQLLMFARHFVGHHAATLVGPEAGAALGWTVGVTLALLLLWPSISEWRREKTAGA